MKSSASQLRSTKIMPTVLSEESDHIPARQSTCRVCMESETPENNLISPCKCKGSLKYIHEECLKTWLVSREGDLEEMKCELCLFPFEMEFTLKSVCKPIKSVQEALTQCLLIPFLLGACALLVFIVVLMLQNYKDEDSKQYYWIAIAIVCIILAVFVLSMIYVYLSHSCITKELAKWSIVNQSFEDDPNAQLPDLCLIPEVMVVPESITISGKRVRTPALQPNMTPVLRGERAVAYSPIARSIQSEPLASIELSFSSR